METIRRKMATNPLKIRVDFSLTCTSYEGVDVIKEALLTAKHAVNVGEWKLDFKMIAPPNYKVEVQTHSKSEGEAKLKQALAIIKEVIKKRGGHFKQKSDPQIIGQSSNEPDVADLIDDMKEKVDSQDEDAEDNEEGMDVDLDDNNVAEAESSDEEEKKQ